MNEIVKIKDKQRSLEVDPQGVEQFPSVHVQMAEVVPVCSQSINQSTNQSVSRPISELDKVWLNGIGKISLLLSEPSRVLHTRLAMIVGNSHDRRSMQLFPKMYYYASPSPWVRNNVTVKKLQHLH